MIRKPRPSPIIKFDAYFFHLQKERGLLNSKSNSYWFNFGPQESNVVNDWGIERSLIIVSVSERQTKAVKHLS